MAIAAVRFRVLRGLPPQIASLMFSDAAIDLALGPNNTAYVTGLAYSSKFPTTPGAFQTVDQSTQHDSEWLRGQIRHHQERCRLAALFDLPGRRGLQQPRFIRFAKPERTATRPPGWRLTPAATLMWRG